MIVVWKTMLFVGGGNGSFDPHSKRAVSKISILPFQDFG